MRTVFARLLAKADVRQICIHDLERDLMTWRSTGARSVSSVTALVGGAAGRSRSRKPPRNSPAILFVRRAEVLPQRRLLDPDYGQVKVRKQEQRQDEVLGLPRGIEQAHTQQHV